MPSWSPFAASVVDLTYVAIEADTRCQEVDRPAGTLVCVCVREAVRDAGRGGREVSRPELDNVVP